jgi:hypothetical protein
MRWQRLARIVALVGAARAAHAQVAPDGPPPDAATTCDGGLCDTSNGSTCSVGASSPSAALAVGAALLLARRRRGGQR